MRVFTYLLLLFLSGSLLAKEPLELSVTAENAILINAATGAILFEKNAHAPAFPASITKIATALYVLKFKEDTINECVSVPSEAIASITPYAKKQSDYRSPPHWLETDADHIGLKKGEQMPLVDLLYAVLVASANDASNVLAAHVCGKIPRFVEEMNAYLKELGCLNTRFLNPHGLHHPNHVTTAYDMAVMAREAMKSPTFRKIVATTRYTCPPTNLEQERTFIQTNWLLRAKGCQYPKATGIKTGTTQAAGKTLVASAEDGERKLIAVVLGEQGNERYNDVIKLFEGAFNEPRMRRQLLSAGPKTLTTRIPGSRGRLKTTLARPLAYEYYPSEEVPVRVLVKWEVPSLPFDKGAHVASLRAVDEQGNIVAEQSLLAATALQESLWHRLIKEPKLLIITAIVFSLLIYFKRRRRSSRPLFHTNPKK